MDRMGKNNPKRLKARVNSHSQMDELQASFDQVVIDDILGRVQDKLQAGYDSYGTWQQIMMEEPAQQYGLDRSNTGNLISALVNIVLNAPIPTPMTPEERQAARERNNQEYGWDEDKAIHSWVQVYNEDLMMDVWTTRELPGIVIYPGYEDGRADIIQLYGLQTIGNSPYPSIGDAMRDAAIMNNKSRNNPNQKATTPPGWTLDHEKNDLTGVYLSDDGKYRIEYYSYAGTLAGGAQSGWLVTNLQTGDEEVINTLQGAFEYATNGIYQEPSFSNPLPPDEQFFGSVGDYEYGPLGKSMSRQPRNISNRKLYQDWQEDGTDNIVNPNYPSIVIIPPYSNGNNQNGFVIEDSDGIIETQIVETKKEAIMLIEQSFKSARKDEWGKSVNKQPRNIPNRKAIGADTGTMPEVKAMNGNIKAIVVPPLSEWNWAAANMLHATLYDKATENWMGEGQLMQTFDYGEPGRWYGYFSPQYESGLQGGSTGLYKSKEQAFAAFKRGMRTGEWGQPGNFEPEDSFYDQDTSGETMSVNVRKTKMNRQPNQRSLTNITWRPDDMDTIANSQNWTADPSNTEYDQAYSHIGTPGLQVFWNVDNSQNFPWSVILPGNRTSKDNFATVQEAMDAAESYVTEMRKMNRQPGKRIARKATSTAILPEGWKLRQNDSMEYLASYLLSRSELVWVNFSNAFAGSEYLPASDAEWLVSIGTPSFGRPNPQGTFQSEQEAVDWAETNIVQPYRASVAAEAPEWDNMLSVHPKNIRRTKMNQLPNKSQMFPDLEAGRMLWENLNPTAQSRMTGRIANSFGDQTELEGWMSQELPNLSPDEISDLAYYIQEGAPRSSQEYQDNRRSIRGQVGSEIMSIQLPDGKRIPNKRALQNAKFHGYIPNDIAEFFDNPEPGLYVFREDPRFTIQKDPSNPSSKYGWLVFDSGNFVHKTDSQDWAISWVFKKYDSEHGESDQIGGSAWQEEFRMASIILPNKSVVSGKITKQIKTRQGLYVEMQTKEFGLISWKSWEDGGRLVKANQPIVNKSNRKYDAPEGWIEESFGLSNPSRNVAINNVDGQWEIGSLFTFRTSEDAINWVLDNNFQFTR